MRGRRRRQRLGSEKESRAGRGKGKKAASPITIRRLRREARPSQGESEQTAGKEKKGEREGTGGGRRERPRRGEAAQRSAPDRAAPTLTESRLSARGPASEGWVKRPPSQ